MLCIITTTEHVINAQKRALTAQQCALTAQQCAPTAQHLSDTVSDELRQVKIKTYKTICYIRGIIVPLFVVICSYLKVKI